MLGGLRLLVLVLSLSALLLGHAHAEPGTRVIAIDGQIGPYWEHQDMHLSGNSVTGSVTLRANESWARVDLEVEERAIGASDGYVVRFCAERCGLSNDDPYVARAMGMGPFTLAFPVDDLDVLYYRVSVDNGVRVDAHVSGSLVLAEDGEAEDPDLSSASGPAVQPPENPPYSAMAVALGIMGTVAVVPALAPRLRRLLPSAPLLGLFTRRETLLDHPVRKRLHELIRQIPGIHLRELRREMDMPPGQVEHHLQKLIHGGYVVTHAVRGYTAHFVPGAVDRRLMAALARVKSDAARNLLSTIADGGCITLGALAERMGIALSTASYHMGSLERLGLVEVRTNGNQRWRVTALGRSFLDLVGPGTGSGSRNGPESA